MNLFKYEGKIVRVIDNWGKVFTGVPVSFPAAYGFHEYNREEEAIQAMAKKHHITLRQEFDEHDGPDTKYIVITDNEFPIATARMYPLDEKRMMIGRVVVLPEYRRQGIGTMVVSECEVWAEELHYAKTVVESREDKVDFYEQMLYEKCGEAVDGDTFRCIRMEKDL